MPTTASAVAADIAAIREKKPLVLSITNYIVAGFNANALLALGASPAMSHAPAEMADLTSISQALVLNLGTLTDFYRKAMLLAGETATAKGVPVALDPVAAGASALRNEVLADVIRKVKISAIRANASEILALAGQSDSTRGVDSTHATDDALDAARQLARAHGCAVCVSGEKDYVTDGERTAALSGGHFLMPMVTGMGCTATALTGAFLAANPDPFLALTHAMAAMNAAGEMAGKDCPGPGSLRVRFLDALFQLDEALMAAHLHLETA